MPPKRTPFTADQFLAEPNCILICGKRNTGKSVMIAFMIRAGARARRFGDMFVFSSTADIAHDFAFVSESHKSSHYDEQTMQSIMDHQAEHIRKYGEDATQPFLVVLDDVNTADVHHSPVLQAAFTRGRHYKISIIVAVQSPKMIGPTARQNADFILMSKQTGAGSSILYDMVSYSGDEPWAKFVARNTDDFRMLCFNNRARNAADQWFTVRADLPPQKWRLLLPGDDREPDKKKRVTRKSK